MQDRRKYINNVPLFSKLQDPALIDDLLNAVSQDNFVSEQRILGESMMDEHIFIIWKGEVKVMARDVNTKK